MKTIDVRFSASDMAEIKSMVGKRMIGYKCDPFIFSTSVYGIVGIRLEDTSYAFTNSLEVMDYFGDPEDVARFRISKVEYANLSFEPGYGRNTGRQHNCRRNCCQ